MNSFTPATHRQKVIIFKESKKKPFTFDISDDAPWQLLNCAVSKAGTRNFYYANWAWELKLISNMIVWQKFEIETTHKS